MKWNCRSMALTCFLCASLLLSACSAKEKAQSKNKEQEAQQAVEQSKPVTLTVAGPKTILTEEEFQTYIIEPVNKKYPHITLTFIDTQQSGQSISNLVAMKQIPDIQFGQQANFANLVDLQLGFDVSELITEHKFDLTRIQEELLDGIKKEIGIDYLPGLPIFQNTWALAYNKAVFDRFGMSYPKDGMTWDEIGDLAKTITRKEQGIQYWGLGLERTYSDGYKQESLHFANFQDNHSLFQTQRWQDHVKFFYELFQKVGSPPDLSANEWNQAWEQGTVAMRTLAVNQFKSLLTNEHLDWDVVTYPQLAVAPEMGMEMNVHWWMITKQSPNQQPAFQVLDVLLSNEVQTALSRGLRLSVLKDATIQNQVGTQITAARNKNTTAYVKLKSPSPVMRKTFSASFHRIQTTAFKDIFYNGKDINTALREADEAMNKAIQESLAR